MFRVICLIFILMSSAVFAQKQQTQAFKFGEFNELQESEWKKRLDSFAEMRVGYPDSRLYIIVYAQSGTERTSIDDLKKQYRDYLYNGKKVSSVSVNSGGFRKFQTAELWIVPDKANYPEATPDEKFKPEKFIEFGKLKESEFNKHYTLFTEKLYKDRTLTGYIINYGKPKDVSEIERTIRNHPQTGRCMYDGIRIVIVNGGFKENLLTQFWLVPQGAEPPTP